MPRKKKGSLPSLRRHRPTRQGVVTLSGQDHYLGVWPDAEKDPPPEVREAYDRKIAEWLAGGRQPLRGQADRRTRQARERPGQPDTGGADEGVTVAELVLAYMRHAEVYYRRKDGSPTGAADNYKDALRPLVHLYAGLPARRLRPRHLKAVRQLLVKGYDHPRCGEMKPCCRSTVNARVAKIIQVYRWAVEEEKVPERTWLRLTTVKPLQQGRSEASETEDVRPVAVEVVRKTLPHLRPPAAGLVRFQLHTGARPGEAMALRLADLDRSGPVWLYTPRQHKTAHKGKPRVIALGPKAQAVLLEFVRIRCPVCGVEGRPPRICSPDGVRCGHCADRCDKEGVSGPWRRVEAQNPEDFLFSPARDREERFEDMRRARKTPVQPSQQDRRKDAPRRVPRQRYARQSYEEAVARACKAAGAEHWHPNQLRHTFATLVRRVHGLEGAQVALGHSKADVTQLYAERDLSLAARVSEQMG